MGWRGGPARCEDRRQVLLSGPDGLFCSGGERGSGYGATTSTPNRCITGRRAGPACRFSRAFYAECYLNAVSLRLGLRFLAKFRQGLPTLGADQRNTWGEAAAHTERPNQRHATNTNTKRVPPIWTNETSDRTERHEPAPKGRRQTLTGDLDRRNIRANRKNPVDKWLVPTQNANRQFGQTRPPRTPGSRSQRRC